MEETTEVAIRDGSLTVTREPSTVIAEANKAAMVLKDIIGSKAKHVTFNGKTYLEYEDWQTVGAFYGVTARVVSAQYVSMDGVSGFEAKADAIDKSGRILTSAESMCLNDEKSWRNKPLFQLKSMAQTRACAGALRRVLSWVVVLAGYSGTPAEEIESMESAEAEPVSDPFAPYISRIKAAFETGLITEEEKAQVRTNTRGATVDRFGIEAAYVEKLVAERMKTAKENADLSAEADKGFQDDDPAESAKK